MTTTKRGGIGITMTNTPQEEVEELADTMVEALRKHEEDNISLTLVEAITLVLEPAELFVAEAKKDSIGNSPRLKKAISQLREFIEN
jgi:hypothetical protein